MVHVVVAPADIAPYDIVVTESGLSDHKLVHWSMRLQTGMSPWTLEYRKVRRRNWRRFDLKLFKSRLMNSSLCLEPSPGLGASDLADRYQAVTTAILDDLAPESEMTVRVRPHCPFYDQDCRQARRSARRYGRAYRRKRGKSREDEAYSTWRAALRSSRRLVRANGRQYWRRTLDPKTNDKKQTWKKL